MTRQAVISSAYCFHRPKASDLAWRYETAGEKDDVDLVMGSQKSLCLSGRFESPHQFLSFAGWLMGTFDTVVEPLVRPMISFRRNSPDRFDITA